MCDVDHIPQRNYYIVFVEKIIQCMLCFENLWIHNVRKVWN